MLIRGEKLNQRQREQVLSAYIYRNTFENQKQRPSLVTSALLVTDSEWIKAHAFNFIADGSRLCNRSRHAEPNFLADK